MNWDAIGAIAETLGAVGVIASPGKGPTSPIVAWLSYDAISVVPKSPLEFPIRHGQLAGVSQHGDQ